MSGQRRRRDFRRALALLESDHTCDVVETRGRGDALRLARDADAALYDAVIVASGDGTINEAANGLAGRDLPLGIIPLGTANVLAHELGIGSSVERAVAIVRGGRRRRIALAKAGERYCCLMVSAGPDARAIRRVRPWLKRLAGEGAYYVAGFGEILAGSKTRFSVVVDGRRLDTASVIVANARLYGGRYVCAPQADINQPILHAVLMTRSGRWNMVRYGLALMRGRLTALPDVTAVAATTVRIGAPVGEPWQGDGDLIGEVPVTVTVVPRALEVLVPGDDG